MNRTRAERRYAKETRKTAAKRMVRDVWRQDESVQHQMACNCDNLKICRGDCCKNERRSGWRKAGGKTFRELLAERIAKGLME